MSQQLDFFHNTTRLLPSEKIEREVKAIKQVDRILAFFQQNKHQEFTPCQLWVIFGQQWPLTNFRRSITDLTKEGKLVMTGNMRTGYYGKEVNTWKYAGN